MKPLFFICFLFLSITSGFAQDGDYKEPSKESQAYHEYRMYSTTPPYGLARVKRLLINPVVKDNEDGSGTNKLPAKAYAALSMREKFTYHMIHGETYSQICDAYPPALDEQKKIFGYLPDALSEDSWSDNQLKFLKDNKDSVMVWMKECINKNKRVGVNFKRTIIQINGVEMIPYLIEIYNIKKKDGDILTVFMQLMRQNNYEPFLKSASFKKLYSEEFNFTAFLNYNKENEALILQRVTDFYNGYTKK